MAHLSQDRALIDALTPPPTATSSSNGTSSLDIHKRIAAQIYHKPEAQVTPEERRKAKSVVFGTLYGMGSAAFAAQMGESVEAASKIQREFRKAFPQVFRYENEVKEQCRRDNGLVRTLMGRVRLLSDINNTMDSGARAASERQAFNTTIQGSAADIIKRAMVDLAIAQQQAQQQQSGSADGKDVSGLTLRCQIHDELVASCPRAQLKDCVDLMRQAMTNSVSLSVPIPVKVRVGPSLGELVDYVE